MVIGFTVVMITLYMLYLILIGFSRCLAKPVKTEPKQEKINVLPPVALEETVAAPVAAAAAVCRQSYGTPPEVVAAIASVLGVCVDSPAMEFSVVPAQTSAPVAKQMSTWSLLGRKTLMERRQDLFLFRRERRK
jgi:Na+-transporting methylmalonyl-CoA/oxaloacetate decarboxylase gamma subunit